MKKSLIVALLVLNIVSRLLLISRPIENLDSMIIPDDAYISLHIARNIAEGKGPTYDDIGHTNGFQPLYVFLTTPLFWVFTDPVDAVKSALVMLTLFDTVTLLILILFIYSLTKNRWVTMLGASFWIFNDYVIQTSLNGLETIMSIFFLVWSSYLFYRMYFIIPERKIKDYVQLGLVIGLACFSRVDSGVFAVLLFAVAFIFELRDKVTLDKVLSRLFIMGVCLLLVFGVWISYSYYFTGRWYPISGKAVRFLSLYGVDHNPTWRNWYFQMLKSGVYTILNQNAPFVLMSMIILAFLFFKKKISSIDLKPFLPLLLFAITIYFAYTLYIFTHWYFYRYLFPFTVVMIIGISQAVYIGVSCFDTKYRKMVPILIGIFWIGLQFGKGEFTSYYFSDESDDGYMHIGQWIKQNMPDGAVIGGSQTGAMSYFGDNTQVINLDGVVNEDCYNALVENRTIDYIKENKIEYIIGWKRSVHFLEVHSDNFKEGDITLIKKIDDLHSWGRGWYLFKVNYR